MPTLERVKCKHCDELLIWDSKLGWVHQDGGRVAVSCSNCGWYGAPPQQPIWCVVCGAPLRVDHYPEPAPESPGE
jgi:hypothetical protein